MAAGGMVIVEWCVSVGQIGVRESAVLMVNLCV